MRAATGGEGSGRGGGQTQGKEKRAKTTPPTNCPHVGAFSIGSTVKLTADLRDPQRYVVSAVIGPRVYCSLVGSGVPVSGHYLQGFSHSTRGVQTP
jgi:hypothetical protein